MNSLGTGNRINFLNLEDWQPGSGLWLMNSCIHLSGVPGSQQTFPGNTFFFLSHLSNFHSHMLFSTWRLLWRCRISLTLVVSGTLSALCPSQRGCPWRKRKRASTWHSSAFLPLWASIRFAHSCSAGCSERCSSLVADMHRGNGVVAELQLPLSAEWLHTGTEHVALVECQGGLRKHSLLSGHWRFSFQVDVAALGLAIYLLEMFYLFTSFYY